MVFSYSLRVKWVALAMASPSEFLAFLFITRASAKHISFFLLKLAVDVFDFLRVFAS